MSIEEKGKFLRNWLTVPEKSDIATIVSYHKCTTLQNVKSIQLTFNSKA